MLRSRIGNMRQLSVQFVGLILLCVYFICSEAGPGIFSRSDDTSKKGIVRLGSIQRKILQDQQTPSWGESNNGNVPKTTDTRIDEGKWEPKADENNKWISKPEVVEQVPHQERNADRDNMIVEKKEPIKFEEQNAGQNVEWHQELGAESNLNISVEKQASYQERKAGIEQTQSEGEKKETNVDEKKENWKAHEEWKPAHEDGAGDGAKIEQKANEKSENNWKSDEWEQKPVVPSKDEEWKVAKVEAGVEEIKADVPKQRSVDVKREELKAEEKKEERKMEEEAKMEERKVEEKPKMEERKVKEAPKMEERKVEGEPKMEERKVEEKPKMEERKVEEKPKMEEKKVEEAPKMEERKVEEEPKVDERKVDERREEFQVDETKQEPKERQERHQVEESKEFQLEDLSEKPKIDIIKEELKMEEKSLEPINVREEKMGENDERKKEAKQVEDKVQQDALKVQDTKEEEATVDPKNDVKYNDGRYSISSKIEEETAFKNSIKDETHSDFDEDYPDFLDELKNFPESFQKTAESVTHHIRHAGLERYSTHSKELFNQANQQIQESFTPLLGEDYAPFLAYLVSYGLLLLPLAIVTYLLDRIRARFSLQKILLFVNIYLSAYFAALMAVALLLESEPMKFFMQYSSSSYIFLQLLQALGYLIYLLLNSADLISTCSNGRIAAKFSSTLQWVVVIAVGFHYYVTVFHRAMIRKAPITGWKIYGLYSVSFFFLCLFARIERGKKQYSLKEVNDTTDKKN